jgi:phosphoketolase
MTATTPKATSAIPSFCEGIQYFSETVPGFETYGKAPAIAQGSKSIADPADPVAVFQTMLGADALRHRDIRAVLPAKQRPTPLW